MEFLITLFDLFITWAKIGLFSIGGGYAMMPLISQEMVSHGWMTSEQVLDVFALSQVTPGPFAVNAATFSGMNVTGFAGGCVATLGVILPSVIICVIISRFFIGFLKHKNVQSVLYGVRPVVVGLIANAAWTAAVDAFPIGPVTMSVTPSALTLALSLDWPMIVLAVAVLLCMVKTKINPILLIGVSAAAGLILHAVGI